jgi:hypothetical protein
MKIHLRRYWFSRAMNLKHFQKAQLVKLHKVVFFGFLGWEEHVNKNSKFSFINNIYKFTIETFIK